MPRVEQIKAKRASPGLCALDLVKIPSLDFSRRGNSEGQQGQINENRDELEHSGPWRSNSLGKLRSDSDELAVCSGELWLRGKAILWPCSRPPQILAVRGTRVG